MFYPNDAQFAQDRMNDRLREAEQRHLIRALQARQPKQPNLFYQLKSELAALANLARPQRNRVNRV